MHRIKRLLSVPGGSVLGALLVSIFILSAQAIPKETKSLSEMSDKEAYKKALADFSSGQLDDALEAIKHAVEKKNKPEYQKKQEEILSALSDREVSKGEQACANLDFENCDRQISKAKAFADTENVKKLQQTYAGAVARLRQQRSGALQLAETKDPEAALNALKELGKYPYVFPDLSNDIGRVTDLWVQKLLSEGMGFIDGRNWDGAESRFDRVLSISAKNEKALEGKRNCSRGREAYRSYANAQAQAKALNYREAYRFILAAIKAYPEGKELDQERERIINSWIKYLSIGLPELMANSNDLQKSRDAYLNLLLIQEFRPSDQDVEKYLPTAQRDFAANALVRAKELTEILDYSRIATAYALKLTAQQLMPQAVQQEELKDLLTIFARKRASQLVFSVEDLAAASPIFVQAVRNRARNRMDDLGCPDLRVRTMEDYEKSPNEDPQFQDLRPDGRSATAELRIGVTKWESVRNSSEKPTMMQSQYVSGKRKVPNPPYVRLKEELSVMRKSLDDPSRKKDKPTKEGWTEAMYYQKMEEFKRIDPEKEEDVVSPYTYQKIEHNQHTSVDLQVTLRDYFSRETIASRTIPFHDERSFTEIAGVKETDVNQLANAPIRLTPLQDVLEKGQRTVLENLDKVIAELIPIYTNRFYNEAEKAVKADRPEDAVEAYLCHWAFVRGKLDPIQSDRIVEIVRRETGFDLTKMGEALYRSISTTP